MSLSSLVLFNVSQMYPPSNPPCLTTLAGTGVWAHGKLFRWTFLLFGCHRNERHLCLCHELMFLICSQFSFVCFLLCYAQCVNLFNTCPNKKITKNKEFVPFFYASHLSHLFHHFHKQINILLKNSHYIILKELMFRQSTV